MNASSPGARGRSIGLRIAIGLAVLAAVLVLVVVFFPWDRLRQPINRYVSEKTGRKFEITRRLSVHPGWRTATIEFDGIDFANPDWARDPYLVRAERVDFDLHWWSLLRGKIDIPRLALTSPALGLQMEPDGRRTWALGKDTSDSSTVPTIGVVHVDHGSLNFLAKQYALDLHADLDYDSSRGELPLDYRVKGSYRNQPLTAQGRTGNVLQITQTGQPPFPIEVQATAGRTQLQVKGSVAELANFDGIDADFDIKGQSLGDLYKLLGVALPNTSPYALKGDLKKNGKLWAVKDMQGRLGLSDLGGNLSFDQEAKTPRLTGELKSQVMDMDDLGPLIGLPPTARSAKAVEGVTPPASVAQVRRAGGSASTKVLPTATLDFERLRAMNADVKYQATKIRNVRELPLDRGSVHVKLDNGVLTLDPLDLGVAGGKLAGAIRIDANQDPADIRASLDMRALQINRLIPKVETLKTSFGRLDGRINLSGRGNSVAGWLGGASGDVAAMTGRGQFSNLLLEVMGLDLGEIIKFLLRGDRNVTLRCGAVAFDVDKGLMKGRSMVFDTSDTVFYGSGQISLAQESMDIVIRPEPKDMSILALRTPLTIGGTFGSPKVGVQAASLASRGIAALALGAINPLLALAATVETGPGEDTDCKGVLAQAGRPASGTAAAGAAQAKSARDPAAPAASSKAP